NRRRRSWLAHCPTTYWSGTMYLKEKCLRFNGMLLLIIVLLHEHIVAPGLMHFSAGYFILTIFFFSYYVEKAVILYSFPLSSLCHINFILK
ncbi:hypothetical protein ACJX0J_028411, partial [Zea mays]